MRENISHTRGAGNGNTAITNSPLAANTFTADDILFAATHGQVYVARFHFLVTKGTRLIRHV